MYSLYSLQISFIAAPGRPSLRQTLDTSIIINFTKLTDTLHAYFYRGEAKSVGATHHGDCNADQSTCKFTRLKPATSYSISIQACFSTAAEGAICSSPSQSITAFTLPSGMYKGSVLFRPNMLVFYTHQSIDVLV